MILKPKGRPPLAKTGEKMHNRNFRATDAEWDDCLNFGGGAWIRKQIQLEKRRFIKMQKENIIVQC